MELKTLQAHIRTLVTLEENGSPVISCYLTMTDAPTSWRSVFEQRVQQLRSGLQGVAWWDFEEAVNHIETYLANELEPTTRGVALFARGGDQPFFLPLQFQVSLPNWIVVNAMPNIYHLVELKDTYHRYVVMLSNAERARILEVNLGAVTEEVWSQRPELRQRVGREWTKEHYQNHRRERSDRFLKEKISILDGLMRGGGHTHLILAGPPWETAQLRAALPKWLAAKLVDMVPSSINEQVDNVVLETLALFILAEEKESQAAVDKLQEEILQDGLAVTGTQATLQALQTGQVDVLVVAKSYVADITWRCHSCASLILRPRLPVWCPECRAVNFTQIDLKEEMVRLAEQSGATVEVVLHSPVLMQLGGIGALLRYRMPAHQAQLN